MSAHARAQERFAGVPITCAGSTPVECSVDEHDQRIGALAWLDGRRQYRALLLDSIVQAALE